MIIRIAEELQIGLDYSNRGETIKDTIPIAYFYPEENDGDRKQAVLVKDFSNVMSFPVITATHGLELNNKERVRFFWR